MKSLAHFQEELSVGIEPVKDVQLGTEDGFRFLSVEVTFGHPVGIAKTEGIHADSGIDYPFAPFQIGADVSIQATFLSIAQSKGANSFPTDGMMKGQIVDVIMAESEACLKVAIQVSTTDGMGVVAIGTGSQSLLGLVDLVAMDRVIQEKGEVGVQIEPIMRKPHTIVESCSIVPIPGVQEVEVGATGVPAFCIVQCAKSAYDAFIYHALGYLSGGIPMTVEVRKDDVEPRVFIPLRVFGHDIEAVEVLGSIEISVGSKEGAAYIQTLGVVVQ